MLKTNSQRRSAWPGVLIAPLVAPTIYILIVVFFPAYAKKEEITLELLIVGFLSLLIVNYVLCITIGFILLKALKRLGKITLSWIAASALLLGAISFSSFGLGLVALDADIKWNGFLFLACTGGMFGLVNATTFCFVNGVGLKVGLLQRLRLNWS